MRGDAPRPAGLMTPSKQRVYLDGRYDAVEKGVPGQYPNFNRGLYAIDTFLPIVDLHVEPYWLPNANAGSVWFEGQFMGFAYRLTSGGAVRPTNLRSFPARRDSSVARATGIIILHRSMGLLSVGWLGHSAVRP